MFGRNTPNSAELIARAIDAWRERALGAERELALAHAREAELAAQIRMVMEERFFHPVVTGQPQPAAPAEIAAPLPVGALEGEAGSMDEQFKKEMEALAEEHARWQAEHRPAEADVHA